MADKKVLCFGELLIRMSPKINGGWIRENSMASYIGGAELNVAGALAKWNVPVKYFTALPPHSLSSDLISYLEKKNIDANSIHISGNRIGLYFLPQGSDLQNADVIYDRAYSSFSELQPGMVDWNEVLSDVKWLHLSAINPALNENAVEVCRELLAAASGKGITISLDLNFRSKLWKYGKKPADVMPMLAQHCDLIMGNIWAAEELLGIPVEKKILQNRNKNACLDHAVHTSEAVMRMFPRVKNVANTFRFDKDKNSILYYATLYNEHKLHVSEEIHAEGIKDKIGSGDCFMAGMIYGFSHGMSQEQIVNFSSAAAVGKMFEISDATDQTVETILKNATKKSIVQK